MAKASVTIPIRVKARNGTNGRDGNDGKDGKDGSDGANGKNAVLAVASPASVSYQAGVQSTRTVYIYINDGGTLRKPTSISAQPTRPGVTVSKGESDTARYYTFTFGTSATINTNLNFSATYDGQTYYGYIQVIRVKNGDPGPAGVTYRQTEWAEGVNYLNEVDKVGTQDICYVDIVIKKDTKGRLSSAHMCKVSHTSSADNAPASSENTWWEPFSKNNPMYTPLLLADNAVIGMMQGNAVKIYNSALKLKAGMTAASGDYPVFYASPRLMPLKVEVMFLANDTSQSVSTNESNWSNRLPTDYNSTNWQLWAWPMATLNTGSRFFYGNPTAVTTYSTSGSLSSYTLYYRTTTSGGIANPKGWQREMYPPDEYYNRLYVKVVVHYGTQGTNYVEKTMICGSYAATEQTDTSLFQVLESGKVKVGEPLGARLELNPFYGSGGQLPRMEVYDTDGEISALFDGSKVSGESELYASAVDTTHVIASVSSLIATVGSGNDTSPGSATAITTICAISSSVAGFIELAPVTVDLTLKRGTYTGDSMSYLHEPATIELWVDGAPVAEYRTIATSQTAQIVSYTFPRRTVRVGKTAHSVQLAVKMAGYSGAEAKASIATYPELTGGVHFYTSRYISRYFANGLCLGSADNNHLMVFNKNVNGTDCMCLQFRNSSGYGLRISNDGIQVWNSSTGQWRTANI